MPVRSRQAVTPAHRSRGARLRDEGGFTMIIALAVLLITSLLISAIFLTVQGDTSLTRVDLDGKRAYDGAQAGLQAYLYSLNDSAATSEWWQTCANDTVRRTAVPGTTTNTKYSYAPVPANGYTACSTRNPVGSLIDSATGTLRMKFTGFAGSSTRTIVAGLRTLSPLSYLWYTVHETLDTAIGGSGCATFYDQGAGPPKRCRIYWATGDKINGPMYTQDQFLVQAGADPAFGRDSQDVVASQAPGAGAADICAVDDCQDARILGTRQPDVTPQVPLPSDNSNLLSAATKSGTVYRGTTTLTVNGTSASGWNCLTATTCTRIQDLDLVRSPILYATNAPGCDSNYDPTNVTYASSAGRYYGACGDIYISGTYTTPLTVAAADDVVVAGDLTTTTGLSGAPTGSATLALVANQYVRVMHTCSANPNVTIDAAILTLQHSFFVDNYQCGGPSLGTLSVHGAIAQYFRGIVAATGDGGYLKNYDYDDRLTTILPPDLFDLQHTRWVVFRETLCSPTARPRSTASCAYAGG